MISPNQANRTRYTLHHKVLGTVKIIEPKGWREDGKVFKRDKTFNGIFQTFSNSLKFLNNGKDFILSVYDIYGINAEIVLTKKIKHPHTDEWTLAYRGFLDLSTLKIKGFYCSVKFNNSGIYQTLKSRKNDKIELERTTDLKGNDIGELQTETITMQGRKIFLKTDWETKQGSIHLYNQMIDRNRDNVGSINAIPLKIKSKSHEIAHEIVASNYVDDDNEGNEVSFLMLAISDRERVFKTKLNISFQVLNHQFDDVDWAKLYVRLVTFKDGEDYNYKNKITLFEKVGKSQVQSTFNQTISISLDQNITLLKGESLSLQIGQELDGKDSWFNLLIGAWVEYSSHMNMEFHDFTGGITIEEDSHYQTTEAKMIMQYEAGQRLTKIITGKDVFYSKALGRTDLGYAEDGTASLDAITHGFWLRGFDRLPLPQEATSTTNEVVNKYKGITTSFKDWFENVNVTRNLGLGIEKQGMREIIKVEELKDFYNRNVTIKLPNKVTDIERKVATDYYYSGLEFGFDKGVENQEAMGLDDPHGKSNFFTIIDRITKTYKKASKYIYSAYAKEFIRRKQKFDYPTTDHPNDKNIFGLSLKRVGTKYKQRLWADDFAEKPKNIFSPETATELLFTPFNILLRHGWYFASGFTKYLTDKLRYGSSTANSSLITKLINGNEYAENGDIINSELDSPLFVPEWITFKHDVTFEISQQIEGKTIINGKKITNYYGLVEFINENNEFETGFLFEVKPNDGKWKVLKSTKQIRTK